MLQYQNITVPFVFGVDESVDERVVPIGSLLDCENGYFDKGGAIAKRNGFGRLTTNILGGGTIDNIRWMFSSGSELCVVGKNKLYSYSFELSSWVDRGWVSPCLDKKKAIFTDARSFPISDLDTEGGLIMYAGEALSLYIDHTTPGAKHDDLVVRVDHESGYNILPNTVLAQGWASIPAQPTGFEMGPRVASCTGKLLLFRNNWSAGIGNSELHCYEYVVATPLTPPVLLGAPFYPVSIFVSGGGRCYDAIGLSTGDYLLVYIHSVNTHILVIERRSPIHTLLAVQTMSAHPSDEFVKVALAENVSDGTVAVFSLLEDGVVANQSWLELRILNRTTLAVTVGPVNMRIPFLSGGPPVERASNLGVVFTGSRVVCTWTVETNEGIEGTAWSRCSVENMSVDLAGANDDGLYVIEHVSSSSRPFVYDDEVYLYCHSQVESVVFEYSALFNIRVQDDRTGDRNSVLAGVFDIGTGPTVEISRAYGVGNNVIAVGTNEIRFMSTSLGDYAADLDQKFVASEITLDFKSAPLASHYGGGSVIGGAFVTWYAGVQTEELGFATPPIFQSITAIPRTTPPYDFFQNSSGSHREYSYTATWERKDEAGNWHRSSPCPMYPWASLVANDAWPDPVPAGFLTDDSRWQVGMANAHSLTGVEIICKTLPATIRPLHQLAISPIFYRNGLDNVFARVSEPDAIIETKDLPYDGFVTQKWTDTGHTSDNIWYPPPAPATIGADPPGDPLGRILYTDAGVEIENVMPEGARIPVTTSDRVWLGRNGGVQFSKNLVPGTPESDAIAPEFNEGFGFVLPEGGDVTGIGLLDDKVAIFTEENIYMIAGNGPDASGRMNDFSKPTLISDDGGCVDPRSVVDFPGGIMFQSSAGIYVLARNLEVRFIGDKVQDLLSQFPEITSGVLVPSENQVRFTCIDAAGTDGVILVFDYKQSLWTYWRIRESAGPGPGSGPAVRFVSGAMHKGVYYAAEVDGTVWSEDSSTWLDDTSVYVPLTIETAWYTPPKVISGPGASAGSWKRVRHIMPLLERKDSHDLTISLSHDFENFYGQVATFTDATMLTWADSSGAIVREQPKLKPVRQKCQAIKVRIQDQEAAGTSTGEGYTIAGLTIEAGIKIGTVKTKAEQRS